MSVNDIPKKLLSIFAYISWSVLILMMAWWAGNVNTRLTELERCGQQREIEIQKILTWQHYMKEFPIDDRGGKNNGSQIP